MWKFAPLNCFLYLNFILNQVMVSAKEEPDLAIAPAMDGLLRIHKRIVDADSDPANAQSGSGKTISTRLLVAATQAGSLIGKQGATIKSIQDSSGCTIRVLGGGRQCFQTNISFSLAQRFLHLFRCAIFMFPVQAFSSNVVSILFIEILVLLSLRCCSSTIVFQALLELILDQLSK
jgi:predicted RNA-binding protein YlqC (UPF0109 family)